MRQAMNMLKSQWKLCAQLVHIQAQSKNTLTKRSWSFGFTLRVTGRFQTLWSVNKHYCMWFVSPLLFLIDFSWSSVRSHSMVSTHFCHLWVWVSGLAIRLLDHDTPVQTHQQTNKRGEKRGNSLCFFNIVFQNANVNMT